MVHVVVVYAVVVFVVVVMVWWWWVLMDALDVVLVGVAQFHCVFEGKRETKREREKNDGEEGEKIRCNGSVRGSFGVHVNIQPILTLEFYWFLINF